MSSIDTIAALRYFKTTDPIMYRLAHHACVTAEFPVAIPKERPEHEYFANIVRSIISQQISTKAADAIRKRVEMALVDITPEAVLSTSAEELRACGLSGQKVKYLKHNAAIWPEIKTADFAELSDEAVITELTKLYGIGRWTAEMFLMFSLARPNVFSYGDLGLMNSLYRQYKLKPHYVRKIANVVDSWSPHRTLASLVLWHTIDNGPVLL